MEMETDGPVPQVVVCIDNYSIAYAGSNLWYGPLTVDADGWALICSIGIAIHPADREIIRDCGCKSIDREYSPYKAKERVVDGHS